MKFFLVYLCLFILIACNNNEVKPVQETNSKAEISTNPDYQKGLALVAKLDCFTCHKIDEPLVGPPYRDVANKYAKAGDTVVTYLANKIIKGGSGIWGPAAMLPHPNISMDDAKTIANYILLLKK